MKAKHVLIGAAVVVLAWAGLSYFLFASGAGGKALASVNGEKITADRFLLEVEKIEEPTRGMIKEDPAKYLDMMIMKALLLQEAKKQGLQPGKEGKGEDELIEEFLQKKFSSPPAASEEEIEEFYEVYRYGATGKTLAQAAPIIKQTIQQQKQKEEYMRFLKGIRDRAAIEVNHERLKAIAVKPADIATNSGEDLAKALLSGKPVLVDFGSNSCIPCRQLRPVLKEIREEQKGKLEVLVIDVNQHQNLAGEYRIQVIPTLVFFDAKGKEMFRQQGFMPKAALMEQIKKIGVS